MTEIEKKYLDQLRLAGFFVTDSYPAGHSCEYGVWVAKPSATTGNSLPGFESMFGDVPIDAPPVMLYPEGGMWVVLAQECAPDLGPGDFKNKWATLQEAVDDIVDLYIGNPERMHRKAVHF